MKKIIKEYWQYGIACGIIVVIIIFYWYSRNIVSGYYELLWFRNYVGEGEISTRWLWFVPLVIFCAVGIYHLIRERSRKK